MSTSAASLTREVHSAQRSIDLVEMENKTLRSKLEKMEREYKELKRAYFELSIKQRHSNHMVGSQVALSARLVFRE